MYSVLCQSSKFPGIIVTSPNSVHLKDDTNRFSTTKKIIGFKVFCNPNGHIT